MVDVDRDEVQARELETEDFHIEKGKKRSRDRLYLTCRTVSDLHLNHACPMFQ